MQEGTVAKKMDRGYGFISVPGQEKELFFHANELQGTTFDELNEGDKVTFEITTGPKGPNAVNVKRV
ncbi:MAG: cold shock domain-containing protein [Parcubacteria group bacterium]|nr:cold shock domain-containing protein [Parcubacteria group bacterium]